MIRRIAVRGYKSLRDVDLELHPLTVVVGPNAAGKSNPLDAIGLLSGTAAEDLQSAFTGHRGDPIHSFTFDERGIDGSSVARRHPSASTPTSNCPRTPSSM